MRALIIDDERLARQELRRLLAAHPEVEVVGEAAHAEAARAALAAHAPDLLLLDVQMPGETGFDLLATLDAVPHVIFTTAYDAYALRAFEVSALDYLVKPIEPARLARALAKVARLLAAEAEEDAATHEGLPAEARLTADDRVFVKDGERYFFVRLGEVRLFTSEGNYTRLHFGRERPLVYHSLNYLKARLDPETFFRASRQHIINVRWIEALDPWFSGGMHVRLEGGLEVEMSRRRAQTFRTRRSL